MRWLPVLVLAAGLHPAAPLLSMDESKKEEDLKQGERPDLKAKAWKKLESGLEVWDIKEGKGEAVKPGSRVKIHYTGWLTDEKATIFDSSRDRGQPATFALGDLIEGWRQGIPGMKPGGVRRLKVPPKLAYGEAGQGKIPGNATLVFEVELIEAKDELRVPKAKPLTDEEKKAIEARLKRPDLNSDKWRKLPSGLEVWDVKNGKGEAVKPGASIVVHYTGWLTDEKATIFDSSVKRGEAATFGLGMLIKGWQEGIPGMKPGGIRRLKIPANLAYGDTAKPEIPANSILVFEIELIDVE